MFKLDLEKAGKPEIKLPISVGSWKMRGSSRKHLLLLYWLCQSLWLWGSQQTIENSERDGNIRPLTCLLRNLYAGQEATVRTGHRTTDWFQIGQGVCQGCILSPCLFNLNAEYIMRNPWLDEAQPRIKISGRNINNLRYTDDYTYDRKQKTKEPHDESGRGEWKTGLKLNIQKTKIMASGPITSWQIDGVTVRNYSFGFQNHCRWWLQSWN